MYNLIMKWGQWVEGLNVFDLGRVFEYTEPNLVSDFSAPTGPDLQKLLRLPTLFAREDQTDETISARAGRVLSPTVRGREVEFEVIFEPSVAPIPQAELHRLSRHFQISTSGRGLTEFNRGHWAVKDADLYRIICTELRQPSRAPTVFRMPTNPHIDPNLVSVMMPFNASLMPVFYTIETACLQNQMACTRADNIWLNPSVIDDVANLIDRSAVVVFDCSGKNANVFYELGLAHAWGKEVIILTDDPADIPFDLRHIRHLIYRNDSRGLSLLQAGISARLREVVRR